MGDASGRPPLPRGAGAWAGLRAPFHAVEVVDVVESTNVEVGRRAERGAAAGLVVVAEEQTSGRGRRDRTWTAPPRSGLTFSVLLRPQVPPARLGWLPLLAGLAAADALSEVTGVRVRLKWPNDVVVEDPADPGAVRKLGGVLSEITDLRSGSRPEGLDPERNHGAVVVGLGLNVSMTEDELPVAGATSLLLEGAAVLDRARLLRQVLDELAARYEPWVDADGDGDLSGLRPAYTVRCTTVGRDVQVLLPGGATLAGQAVGVDGDGCLRVVDAATAEVRTVAAGDVVHVR